MHGSARSILVAERIALNFMQVRQARRIAFWTAFQLSLALGIAIERQLG